MNINGININIDDVIDNFLKTSKNIDDEIEKGVVDMIDLINSYESFNLFLKDHDLKCLVDIENVYQLNGYYTEQSGLDYMLNNAIKRIGRKLTDDEFNRLDDEWSSSAYYYKGYIFGIAYGQGSFAWLVEDTIIIQQDLFD